MGCGLAGWRREGGRYAPSGRGTAWLLGCRHTRPSVSTPAWVSASDLASTQPPLGIATRLPDSAGGARWGLKRSLPIPSGQAGPPLMGGDFPGRSLWLRSRWVVDSVVAGRPVCPDGRGTAGPSSEETESHSTVCIYCHTPTGVSEACGVTHCLQERRKGTRSKSPPPQSK